MSDDAWVMQMPLDGRRISELRLSLVTSYYVRLVFWGIEYDPPARVEYQLEIEGAFSLRIGNKERWVKPGATPPPECLRLIEKTVSRSRASALGDLRLDFSDGGVLIVPWGHYEAWQIKGTDGSLIVSVAGGGLSRMART